MAAPAVTTILEEEDGCSSCDKSSVIGALLPRENMLVGAVGEARGMSVGSSEGSALVEGKRVGVVEGRFEGWCDGNKLDEGSDVGSGDGSSEGF